MNQKEPTQCFHIVRCAVTPEERAEAHKAIEYARSVGDMSTVKFVLRMLSGPCCGVPSQLTRALAMLPGPCCNIQSTEISSI